MSNIKDLHPQWIQDQRYLDGYLLNMTHDHANNWTALPPATQQWLKDTLQRNKLPMQHSNVYRVPVVSKGFCDKLVRVFSEGHWQANPDEDPLYQMPEIVLDHDYPAEHRYISDLLEAALLPWIITAYGRTVSSISSIQLARYQPNETPMGNWHIDEDSDFTAVISLNPGDFQGGGTEFRDGLVGEYQQLPIAKGSALLFDGKRTWHRGLPVSQGTRYILSIWMKSN